jgi:3-methyladenine DNA glycosylase AlkD
MLSSEFYFNEITSRLSAKSNLDNATKMKAYMKDKFSFYGVPSPIRRQICKGIYAEHGLSEDPVSLAKQLWTTPYREAHYVAQELLLRSKKQWRVELIEDLEWFLTTNSWWDTIDFLASNVVGQYFKKWPEHQEEVILAWNKSPNMWLVRTSIIFQLKYKDELDTQLLTQCILPHADDTEFFIKKAIGWALRQYSKYNAAWVSTFLAHYTLQPLSIREASKYL